MLIRTYEVGMLSNNNYLVYDEDTKDAFVVDITSKVQKLYDDIKALGLNLKYIILTHGHFDHINGVQWLRGEFPDALVVGNKKELVIFEDRKLSNAKGSVHLDKFVSDGDELTCGNMTLKIIETPGHTVGGISIVCGNVLFSGDTLFQGSVGRTDFPTGDTQAIIDSITKKLFLLPDDTRVLCGHGPETSIGFEKRYNPFV